MAGKITQSVSWWCYVPGLLAADEFVAAGMLGAIAFRSCVVQRAAVYQRRRPERTSGW